MRYLHMILTTIILFADQVNATDIFEQQNTLHGQKYIAYREALLQQWRGEIDRKKYTPKKTYLFGQGTSMNAFTPAIIRDLAALGITATDHKNRDIGQAEKIVLLRTQDTFLAEGDWVVVDNRLRGARGHKPMAKASILPVHMEGNVKLIDDLAESYPIAVTPTMDMAGETYLGLLMKITRFACDIPEQEDPFTETLKECFEANGSFKTQMGM